MIKCKSAINFLDVLQTIKSYQLNTFEVTLKFLENYLDEQCSSVFNPIQKTSVLTYEYFRAILTTLM